MNPRLPGFESLGYLLAFLGCVLGPGWVYLRDPRREANRAFATLGLSGAIFNGLHWAALHTRDLELRLTLMRLAFVGAFLLLPLVIRFPVSLLGPELGRRRLWIEVAAYAIALGFIVHAASGGLLHELDPRGFARGGLALGLWSVTIGLAFLRFAYVLDQAYVATEDKALKNRILYLVLGTVLFGVPAFFDLVYRVGYDHRLPFPMASFGSLAFLACLGVAVVKHKLLEIEVVIHRGLVLTLLAPALAFTFVILGELTEKLTAGALPPDSPYPEILAALLVAALFEPLSRLISHLIETYVISEFRDNPRLKAFRELPFLIGAEDLPQLRTLHQELGTIIERLEARGNASKPPPLPPDPGTPAPA